MKNLWNGSPTCCFDPIWFVDFFSRTKYIRWLMERETERDHGERDRERRVEMGMNGGRRLRVWDLGYFKLSRDLELLSVVKLRSFVLCFAMGFILLQLNSLLPLDYFLSQIVAFCNGKIPVANTLVAHSILSCSVWYSQTKYWVGDA